MSMPLVKVTVKVIRATVARSKWFTFDLKSVSLFSHRFVFAVRTDSWLAVVTVKQVRYLGNVLTAFVKGDGCVDRPTLVLWNNYTATSAAGTYTHSSFCL